MSLAGKGREISWKEKDTLRGNQGEQNGKILKHARPFELFSDANNRHIILIRKKQAMIVTLLQPLSTGDPGGGDGGSKKDAMGRRV
jgi:hypothetical protein